MKIVRSILLGVLLVIVVALVVAALAPSDYAVEKEVKINKPKAEVFNYVKLLKNQDLFSVWMNMDPNVKKTYLGTDGTVGFVSAWESDIKDVGKGEQEILDIIEGQRIEYELRFLEPFEATDKAYMETETVNDSVTLVKWGFYGSMKYPMNLMLLFMDMEEMLGGQLQEGLDNLKELQEK